MFDGATQEGVMFHLVGALSEFGKLGLVCIGSTPEKEQKHCTIVRSKCSMQNQLIFWSLA